MERITPSSSWRVDRKLWLTSDKERVVEDGHPEAAFLFASEGDEITDEDAKRYGVKQAAAPANKARGASANK